MFRLPGKDDFIDIHSHKPSLGDNVFQVFNVFFQERELPDINSSFSLGLHPWHIQYYPNPENLEKDLFEKCLSDKVLMVGETGLDKLREPGLSFQKKVFRIHIRVSEKLGKPLIIHCVKAYEDLLKIRAEEKPVQSWIIHGFDSSPEMAVSLVQQGIYLSAGERLLKKKEKSRKVLSKIPLSCLFIESDDGNWTIDFLYQLVAGIYEIELPQLKKSILGNFQKIFTNA